MDEIRFRWDYNPLCSRITIVLFMKLILWLHRAISTLNQWVGNCIAWVVGLLVCVVFVDVCMRYLFNTSFVFTQELEWHLFGFIFLMGAGYTLLHDGHVRVDVIYQRVSPKPRPGSIWSGSSFFWPPAATLSFKPPLNSPSVRGPYWKARRTLAESHFGLSSKVRFPLASPWCFCRALL